eukprot:7589814-Pyramimonas_sp.AAC.1
MPERDCRWLPRGQFAELAFFAMALPVLRASERADHNLLLMRPRVPRPSKAVRAQSEETASRPPPIFPGRYMSAMLWISSHPNSGCQGKGLLS